MTARIAATVCLCLLAGPALAAQADTTAASLHADRLGFLLDTDRPRRALLEARARPAVANAVSDSTLARALADYGLLEAATQRYGAMTGGDGGNPDRSRAWLSLAQAWYARGRHARALDAVRRISGQVPEETARAAGALEGRILLAQGDAEAAVTKLRESARRYEDPLTRYNLGVALVRAGKNEEGAGELNAIGRVDDASSPATEAFRDKTNLVLAYGFLELGQGATARGLFERVRLEGPYSDSALLGLGWAELAPDGDPQTLATVRPIPCMEDPARLLPDSLPVLRRMPREACGPPRMFRERDEFETDEGADSREARYRRALVPWSELAKRNGGALPIQEALVAVPYAYRELGAQEQAVEGFKRAITRIQARRESVEAVLEHLENIDTKPLTVPDGEPDPAWLARHWDLPDGEHAAYLGPVATGSDFRLSARAMRDLAVLTENLASGTAAVDELKEMVEGFIYSIEANGGEVPEELHEQQNRLRELGPRIEAVRKRAEANVAGHEQHLRRLAKAGARAYKRYLETYLTQARRGRAGIYDAASSRGGRSTP